MASRIYAWAASAIWFKTVYTCVYYTLFWLWDWGMVIKNDHIFCSFPFLEEIMWNHVVIIWFCRLTCKRRVASSTWVCSPNSYKQDPLATPSLLQNATSNDTTLVTAVCVCVCICCSNSPSDRASLQLRWWGLCMWWGPAPAEAIQAWMWLWRWFWVMGCLPWLYWALHQIIRPIQANLIFVQYFTSCLCPPVSSPASRARCSHRWAAARFPTRATAAIIALKALMSSSAPNFSASKNHFLSSRA